MSTLRSRLDRLEQTNASTVFGRFITVRSGECDDSHARRYLADQGVRVGPRDLVLVETHADCGTGGPVERDEPISHEIIECTDRFEDMLARLEVEC
jgi:hypothetical protein